MKVQLDSYLSQSPELLAGLFGSQAATVAPSGSSRSSQRRLRTETRPLMPVIEPQPTMTARQLMRISLDEILASFSTEKEEIEYLNRYIPLLMEIAAAETEQTFGYHGASQEVRLFQDALKVIYEEKLGITLPKDFHFLRIPGDQFLHETDDVKKEFLEHRPTLEPEIRAHALNYYILRRFNEQYGLSLTAADFSAEALAEIERFAMSVLKKFMFDEWNPYDQSASIFSALPVLAKEISELSDLSIEEVNFKLNEICSTSSIRWNDGFKQYLEKVYCVTFEDLRAIDHDDRTKIDAFFARHEEMLKLSSQWDHFYWFFGDTNAEGSSRVISMVGPLFGGLEPDGTGESCLGPFLGNGSYEFNDMRLELILNRFCESLGMAKNTGTKLMEAGRQIVYGEGEKNVTGVLFQLYDISSDQAVDRVTYLTESSGHPIHRAQKINTSDFVKGKLKEDLGLEIRLIMDNGTSLNPNGPIRMVRYDTLPEGAGEEILGAMRGIVREAEVDAEKVEQYKKKLNEYW